MNKKSVFTTQYVLAEKHKLISDIFVFFSHCMNEKNGIKLSLDIVCDLPKKAVFIL